MADGTLGNHTSTEYKIELFVGAKPYHAKPFPISKVDEKTFKLEVDWLVCIGVLKRKNNSKWATRTFIIPKTNGIVCYISDFRELDKRIRKKPKKNIGFTFKTRRLQIRLIFRFKQGLLSY